MAQERQQEQQGAGAGAGRRSDEAVLAVAGAVDLVLEQAEGALRRVRALLSRSDLLDLAGDVRDDLVARGRNSGLGPTRPLPVPSIGSVALGEPHMELVARQLREAQAGPPAGATGQASAAAPEGTG
ncbi:hypothetical protein [Streptomyces sp. NPDC048057]|uniref:hypothetical protein n=1 Tax=Streptomyces sp. NPDC048057 TaxID=3155628 RepID=UPI0033D2694B